MGVQLLNRLHQSPLLSQLEEASSLHPCEGQCSCPVSFSAGRLSFSSVFLESRSRVALISLGHSLKPDLTPARRRGLAVGSHRSSFSNRFDGGSDWNAKDRFDRECVHGERDQSAEHLSAGGSPDNGFWSSGTGLSVAQRSAINRPFGTPDLPKIDSGACQEVSLEPESFVRRDLRTFADDLKGFCPVKKVCGEGAGSASRQFSLSDRAAGVGVGIPFSLKILKQRQSRGKLMVEVGKSLQEAFSSMVFMMRTLQSHTLDMRRQIFLEEVGGLLNMVQLEMHSSFVWLFQQIFSCTPELMILVMILLANFTVYSVGNNPAFTPLSPPMSSLAMVSFLTSSSNFSDTLEAEAPITKSSESFRYNLEKAFLSSPPLNDGPDLHIDSGWVGNGGGKSYAVAGGEDGDSYLGGESLSGAIYLHEDIMPPEVLSMAASVAYEEFGSDQSELSCSSGGLSVPSMRESDDDAHAQGGLRKPVHSDSVVLDQETIQNIVAPVSARLEDDDYSCYDRTDLAYQEAISNDAMNPLLLANYAQFLFLVRHDHDRAEDLFRRAVIADPCNSDAIGCFASFLWLARHNLAAAERAYKAALSADPGSPFHAASYAHFLWHLGQ